MDRESRAWRRVERFVFYAFFSAAGRFPASPRLCARFEFTVAGCSSFSAMPTRPARADSRRSHASLAAAWAGGRPSGRILGMGFVEHTRGGVWLAGGASSYYGPRGVGDLQQRPTQSIYPGACSHSARACRRGRCVANVFVEWLWRRLEHEGVSEVLRIGAGRLDRQETRRHDCLSESMGGGYTLTLLTPVRAKVRLNSRKSKMSRLVDRILGIHGLNLATRKSAGLQPLPA